MYSFGHCIFLYADDTQLFKTSLDCFNFFLIILDEDINFYSITVTECDEESTQTHDPKKEWAKTRSPAQGTQRALTQKHREDRGKQTTHSRWVQPSAWLPELIAHSQNTERTNSFTSYHWKQCWVHFDGSFTKLYKADEDSKKTQTRNTNGQFPVCVD